jgi:quercetin dioxygenase-like cupin family protein
MWQLSALLALGGVSCQKRCFFALAQPLLCHASLERSFMLKRYLAAGRRRRFYSESNSRNGKSVATLAMALGVANREFPRHMHPGVEIGYVLEGSIVDFKIGDALPITVNPGESFVVPANTPHSGKWGPNGMKGLAIMVLEKDKPAFIPVP